MSPPTFDPKAIIGRSQFALDDFEVSAAGELVSFVDGAPYFRTVLPLAGGPVEALTIAKPTGPVTLRLTGDDTLVMLDPERGELEYRRAGSTDRR